MNHAGDKGKLCLFRQSGSEVIRSSERISPLETNLLQPGDFTVIEVKELSGENLLLQC